MKRLIWIAAMALVTTVAVVPAGPSSAYAFEACDEMPCTRNIHCVPMCSHCDSENPITAGGCSDPD